MIHQTIKLGEVECISIYAVDANGSPLVGATDIYVRIRRKSDGYYLDWGDMTFKAVGWAILDKLLSETDSSRDPGNYETSFDSGAVTNLADTEDLTVRALQSLGTNATLPPPAELQVRRGSIDSIGVGVSRSLGLLHENSLVDSQDYDLDGNLVSARLRVFDSAVNLPVIPGGTETTGLLFEYLITAGYSNGRLDEYKIERVT